MHLMYLIRDFLYLSAFPVTALQLDPRDPDDAFLERVVLHIATRSDRRAARLCLDFQYLWITVIIREMARR